MGQRKPRANWQTTQLKNANLSDQALAVVNGLTAAIALFANPPIIPAALQSQLNNYNTALALSIGGSKQQRKEMATQRELLRSYLVTNGQYVNQIVWSNILIGQSYVDASADIVSSGYILGKQPSPVGALPVLTIKKWGSPLIGQLHVQAIKQVGARAYILKYGLPGTDISTWTSITFPSTRMRVNGLQSGLAIQWIAAGVCSSPERNFCSIKDQVII